MKAAVAVSALVHAAVIDGFVVALAHVIVLLVAVAVAAIAVAAALLLLAALLLWH